MQLELKGKITAGLERLGEVFKSLIWEKAKVYGISPIQIQILLFVGNHRIDYCNVSYLAKEFGVTKPTISDAVKVLLKKGYLEKDDAPTDNRRYNLVLSESGKKLAEALLDYKAPVEERLDTLDEKELIRLYQSLTNLIFQLNQTGVIQVQRTCFGCHYYQGDRQKRHFCSFLEQPLQQEKIRLDCPEFEAKNEKVV